MELTEKQVKKLKKAADITEIQMLMGRFIDYLDQMDMEPVADKLFAIDHPEVSIEMVENGAYEGPEHVRLYLKSFDEYLKNPVDKRGWMNIQDLCTPYVIISNSGERARGMWHVFGPQAKQGMDFTTERRTLMALWFAGKYDMEFIKIDGEWKILKMHLIAYMKTPYDLGWVKAPDCMREVIDTGIKPDKPPRNYIYHPDGNYSKTGAWDWGPFLPLEGSF